MSAFAVYGHWAWSGLCIYAAGCHFLHIHLPRLWGYEPIKARDSRFLIARFPYAISSVLIAQFSKTSTAQVRTELEKRGLLSSPRLLQFPTYVLGKACWATDPNFNIEHHLHAVQKPVLTLDQLGEFAGSIASHPFPLNKPNWCAYVIENFQGGSALVLRFHHAYQDGAWVHILADSSDPECSRAFYGLNKPSSRWKWLVTPAAWLLVPYELITRLRIPPDNNPLCNVAYSGEKTIAMTGSLPLRPHLERAKAMGVTFNDYAIAAALRVLSSYLSQQHQTHCDRFTLALPVSLREAPLNKPLQTGNFLTFLMHPMPSCTSLTFEKDIHETLKKAKKGPIRLQASSLALQIAAFLPNPAARILGKRMGTIATLAFSNVPGPKAALSYSSVQLQQLFATAVSGVAVTAVMVSYADHFTVTWNADKAVIQDIGILARLFEAELAKSLKA